MATMLPERPCDGDCGDRQDLLLAARLAVPHTPRIYVDRPRISRCLDGGATLPLTLVSAPAGSGKTTAVAAWVSSRLHRTRNGAVGWVSFEAGKDSSDGSWSLVHACLRDCGVAIPEKLVAGPRRDRRRMLRVVGAALAELPCPLTLVLDNFESAEADLAETLDFLLGHSASRLRVVIVTRSDPVLPLHRFRLYDALAEVRMADLAFTEAETAELLIEAGINLRPDSIRSLVERTRGWAAGLRFASMTLERCHEPDLAVSRLAGDCGDIAEYLSCEMLQTQPDEVRTLLLRTSVVDVLQPGLIEELGGRSGARTLSALVRANALVEEVPDSPGWYRYHPVFRELLCAELARSSRSRLTTLQRRAAHWYRNRGLATNPELDPTHPFAPVSTVVAGSGRDNLATGGATLRVVRDEPSPHESATGPRYEPSVGLVIEPLTEREKEVLGNIAQMLSTDEIAAAMFVSVNTVRTHIRNILRKLAVNRRNDAVRRARALSIIEA